MSKKFKDMSAEKGDEIAMNKPSRVGRDEFVSGVGVPATVGHSKEDWIGNQLRKVYSDAISEDVPDDMLALLNMLDEPDGDAGGSDEGASS